MDGRLIHPSHQVPLNASRGIAVSVNILYLITVGNNSAVYTYTIAKAAEAPNFPRRDRVTCKILK